MRVDVELDREALARAVGCEYFQKHAVFVRGQELRLRSEGLFDLADMHRQFADGLDAGELPADQSWVDRGRTTALVALLGGVPRGVKLWSEAGKELVDWIRLTSWSIGYGEHDAYLPPELLRPRLMGLCQGHPRKENGSHITTTPIWRVDGRFVVTKSGSHYELVGDPEPGYLEYLKTIGREYDPENPIKVRRREEVARG
jgi:hypothetical protein